MVEVFVLGLIGIFDNELVALLHDADDRASSDDDTADTIPRPRLNQSPAPATSGRWAVTG